MQVVFEVIAQILFLLKPWKGLGQFALDEKQGRGQGPDFEFVAEGLRFVGVDHGDSGPIGECAGDGFEDSTLATRWRAPVGNEGDERDSGTGKGRVKSGQFFFRVYFVHDRWALS